MSSRRTSTVVPSYLIARLLLIILVLTAMYFFVGFLVPVLAALIICFASWSFYEKLHGFCRQRSLLSASLATILVIITIIVPLTLVLSLAVEEIRSWIGWLLEANQQGMMTPDWIVNLPRVGSWLELKWNEYLSQPHALGDLITQFNGQQLGNIYRWAVALSGRALDFILALVFMLIFLFFAYRDGAEWIKQLDTVGERVLPNRWQRFSRVVPATVSATVMGMSIVAIGEGLVLGIAYWLAGVPSFFALGVATGFMALIPGGAPLAFTLVSIYLLGSGEMGAAIGLFIWGTIELFIVDKTIRPRLIGGPIKLSFVPTFFGLVGGVQAMGLVGLFIGPVLMALLVAIWREWLHASSEAPVNHYDERSDLSL